MNYPFKLQHQKVRNTRVLTTTVSSSNPKSSTNRGRIPVLMTTSIRSLGPSVRYEMAQHASDWMDLSLWWSSWIMEGSICWTALKRGKGFLFLQRFDRVQVRLRRYPTWKTLRVTLCIYTCKSRDVGCPEETHRSIWRELCQQRRDDATINQGISIWWTIT